MRAITLSVVVAASSAALLASASASAFDQAAVQREVESLNESLPAMVSPVLREEPVKFTGKALLYTFTHVGRSADDIARQNVGANARSYLLGQLCNDADTRDLMHDGLVFSFVYVDPATTRTDGAVITEQDCTKGATR